MGRLPETGWSDLPDLAGRLVGARLGGGDMAGAAAVWLRDMARRHGGPDLVANLAGRRVLLVASPELSRAILAEAPSAEGFVAGTMKRKAMSFLAPRALTILDGEAWRRMRAYNEAVLLPGRAHAHLPRILAHVEAAFRRPVGSTGDIRARMGEVMLATVFGEGAAPASLAGDIRELFAEVNLRTALFGSRKGAKAAAFRAALAGLWQRAGDGEGRPSLLALGHGAAGDLAGGAEGAALLLDQVPHWMFTFTGSGSDLLARTLAMILARPEVLARAREAAEAGGATEGEGGGGGYLEACIRETGRLYPPAALTGHRAARGRSLAGHDIEAGMEILHYFPLVNRDAELDPAADRFRPERWLDPGDPIHGRAVNTFLSGARACPGRDLILAVIGTAIATLLRETETRPRPSRLGVDPLPFSFPKRDPLAGG